MTPCAAPYVPPDGALVRCTLAAGHAGHHANVERKIAWVREAT